MTPTETGMMIMTERRIMTIIFTMINFISDSLSLSLSHTHTPRVILEFKFGWSAWEDRDFNTYRVDVAMMLWKKHEKSNAEGLLGRDNSGTEQVYTWPEG